MWKAGSKSSPFAAFNLPWSESGTHSLLGGQWEFSSLLAREGLEHVTTRTTAKPSNHSTTAPLVWRIVNLLLHMWTHSKFANVTKIYMQIYLRRRQIGACVHGCSREVTLRIWSSLSKPNDFFLSSHWCINASSVRSHSSAQWIDSCFKNIE